MYIVNIFIWKLQLFSCNISLETIAHFNLGLYSELVKIF